jgi:DNA (cytosine-5)-methyltransferase 1
VRRELWALGYASVPVRVRACELGAPFRGQRVFVVGAADQGGESSRALYAQTSRLPELARALRQDWGHAPPDALGVADGTPHGVDRVQAYGDAVMPIMGELVGRFLAPVLEQM